MQQHPGASLRFHFVARRTESPRAGTRYCVQYLIHQMSTASLARLGQMAPCPLRFLERERTEGRKREKFYICLDVTHTHTPGQSRVNPERQEKEKSGHTTGRRPKTAQGGEGNRRTSGTNLHGETDLAKTAHTPKPHDTLRRGTRGKLGTKWGTSW